MATPPLPPATGRLVGWLLILAGILLGLGLLLQLSLEAYQYTQASTAAPDLGRLALSILGLVGASLLVRYGRRLWRGGHLSDGPAKETVL